MKIFLKSYFFTVLICTLLLVSIALIPRDSIKENIKVSAEYLNIPVAQYHHYLIEGVDSSRVDEIADANLLNIAYYLDEEHPLNSIMWCRLYFFPQMQTKMFYEAVNSSNIEPNTQYLRYWHGSLAFIRPMLLFWNIKQIYAFHAIMITVLFLSLLLILFKNKLYAEGIIFTISMIVVSIWIVPLCLEYTWMFILMFLVSIISILMALREKYDSFYILFFITGMVTIFLDFFTTETITILIPLMLVLRIRIRQGKTENWIFTVKCCFTWGIGYVSMWVSKWILASCVLKINAFTYVKDNMVSHVTIPKVMTAYKFFREIIYLNVKCLFPLSYIMALSENDKLIFILLCFFVLVITVFIIWRFNVTTNDWKTFGVFAFLGLIPYARFLIICHHSDYHYFFTYRAQAASIMAFCFVIAEIYKNHGSVPKRKGSRS